MFYRGNVVMAGEGFFRRDWRKLSNLVWYLEFERGIRKYEWRQPDDPELMQDIQTGRNMIRAIELEEMRIMDRAVTQDIIAPGPGSAVCSYGYRGAQPVLCSLLDYCPPHFSENEDILDFTESDEW